jgi:hypothetical protein
MKASKYPRFRSITRKGRAGQVWVYYRYDMRPEGKPDIQLGTDYAAAIAQWERLHKHLPLTIGRVQEAIDRWRDRELPKYENTETRKSYEKQLKNVEAWCGKMSWHEITLPLLRQYLDKRSAKIQGNRELAVLSIVWGKARLWGMTALHWPAAGVKGWKNEEQARSMEVTDALFAAIYAQADRILRDSMDIATATGMRITDVRTIRQPTDGKLRFRAGKTGKWAEFEVVQSPVLTALVKRREAMKAHSVMLLTTDTGRQVSERMLSDRWDDARGKAAKAHPELAEQILAMYNRDMRKRAADLAEDTAAASKLLQHSSLKLTEDHYRTKATKLKAVR